MTVTQFSQHVSQHLKELFVAHLVAYLLTIPCMDLVPIELVLPGLIVKEAIMLVDDSPKRLEVSPRRVVVFGLVDT